MAFDPAWWISVGGRPASFAPHLDLSQSGMCHHLLGVSSFKMFQNYPLQVILQQTAQLPLLFAPIYLRYRRQHQL